MTGFSVTFDHLHSLHGGLVLTIRGDGSVQQQAVRTKAGEPKDRIAEADLRTLVALLVKHEVWTQRVEERLPRPDESIASLKTCYRDQCVEVWEWYNDLEKNARINDILQHMQQIAWKPAAPKAWKVTIDTSGGFTGRGTGSVAVASNGTIGTGPVMIRSCAGELAPGDLQRLTLAVTQAQPAAWKPSYVRAENPDGCCDQFRYTLTLEIEQADGSRTVARTFWYSEMSKALPGDLQQVFETAWSMKREADARCKRG